MYKSARVGETFSASPPESKATQVDIHWSGTESADSAIRPVNHCEDLFVL